MNNIRVSVAQWTMWQPDTTNLNDTENFHFLAPNFRRRLSIFTRMAIYAAHHCFQKDQDLKNTGIVFCSQYGELERTSKILHKIAKKEAMSPIEFSQSTHHTAASLFTIAHKLQAPATTISAGTSSFELAFIEAWTILHTENKSNVLFIYCDEPLPKIFNTKNSDVKKPAALALLLTPHISDDNTPHLQLSWGNEHQPKQERPAETPFHILQLLQAGKGSWEKSTHKSKYIWSIV